MLNECLIKCWNKTSCPRWQWSLSKARMATHGNHWICLRSSSGPALGQFCLYLILFALHINYHTIFVELTIIPVWFRKLGIKWCDGVVAKYQICVMIAHTILYCCKSVQFVSEMHNFFWYEIPPHFSWEYCNMTLIAIFYCYFKCLLLKLVFWRLQNDWWLFEKVLRQTLTASESH